MTGTTHPRTRRAAALAVIALTFSISLERAALPLDVAAASPAPPAAVSDHASPGRVFGASADEQRLVDWAFGRFAAAGLAAPRVDIVFHADRADCDGLAAYAASGPSGSGEIHLCTERQPWTLVSRRVLLHEMAHAWAATALEAATRFAFLTNRALPSWDDPNTPWELRGTEQAAEIIAWGLLDEEIRVVAIPDTDPQRLLAGYVLLTGARPPRLR